MIDYHSAPVLSQPPAAPYSPLLSLKSGTEWPPIFMVHGLGGNALEFSHLAKDLSVQHPIYGIQERGLEGASQPLETVEDMAQTYLRAIERLQTTGPYLLVGHSFGGLVALEMAHTLSSRGKDVGLLAMLDTYPHASLLTAGQRIRLIGRRAMRRLSSVQFIRSHSAGPQLVRKQVSPAMRQVRECTQSALRNYKPRFYNGKITFVRAAVQTTFPDPMEFWPQLAAEFEFDTVPGDHLGMLSTHSKSLASVLNRQLRSAHAPAEGK